MVRLRQLKLFTFFAYSKTVRVAPNQSGFSWLVIALFSDFGYCLLLNCEVRLACHPCEHFLSFFFVLKMAFRDGAETFTDENLSNRSWPNNPVHNSFSNFLVLFLITLFIDLHIFANLLTLVLYHYHS